MSTLTWMPELKGRSLMRMTSFTDEEMLNLIDLAAQLKARRAAGIRGDLSSRASSEALWRSLMVSSSTSATATM